MARMSLEEMMKSLAVLGVLLAATLPAHANDTTAQLGTGGLVFVTNEQIQMASEDLSISPTEVKVVYSFNNTSSETQDILVAFPMPDIEGSGDFMTDVPIQNAEYNGMDASNPDNLFGFETSLNGTAVDAELHQYAFNNNIDYSDLLQGLGVPLEPFGQKTYDALQALAPEDVANLTRLGLVLGMEYDAGNGPEVDLVPLWTLRSTYSWEASFPPGESSVVHTYRPSVGGTVATTFMPEEGDEYSAARFAEYQAKYCVDDAMVSTLKKQAVIADGYTSYPYYENWISYIWSTGNNWSGPIGKFTLTVDKGDADSLVSFCGENVKKIGPTTFRMTATDWYPSESELEILLLKKTDMQ